MKKTLTFCLILFFALTTYACAMGPIFVGPKVAAWDSEAGATQYYLYWRTPGATVWDNANRIVTTAVNVDMVAAGVPQGSWEICVTAANSDSESGPSNIVAWAYVIIKTPANLRKQ